MKVAELAMSSGTDLGTSAWFTVGQDRVDKFADATEDHQWVHVDPEHAAAGLFGATIGHGYLTLSLVPHLLTDLLEITDERRGTNFGLDRVRFPASVRVGSRTRLHAAIAEAAVRDDGGVSYRISLRVEAEGQEKPAMVGEPIYLSFAD